MSKSEQHHDAFISHASEDKETLVRPLADELTRLGMNLWFDEELLVVGDSLKSSIDAGLARSRYGIVVVSPEFLAKPWPRYELEEILKKNPGDSARMLLPIWHGVTAEDVESKAPGLAGIVALESRVGVAELARRITQVIVPGIKTALKLLPPDKKEELIQGLPHEVFIKEVLKSGVPFEDVVCQVMANRTLREFLRHYHERGATTYDPDEDGTSNMIADYNMDDGYDRAVEYIVTWVRRAGLR